VIVVYPVNGRFKGMTLLHKTLLQTGEKCSGKFEMLNVAFGQQKIRKAIRVQLVFFYVQNWCDFC
jgi:hypothetical protein